MKMKFGNFLKEMEKNTENLFTIPENLIEKNFEGEVIFKLDKYLMEK